MSYRGDSETVSKSRRGLGVDGLSSSQCRGETRAEVGLHPKDLYAFIKYTSCILSFSVLDGSILSIKQEGEVFSVGELLFCKQKIILFRKYFKENIKTKNVLIHHLHTDMKEGCN